MTFRSARYRHDGRYNANNNSFRNSGFTLVQLTVTVVVIALLAALLLSAFQRVTEHVRQNQCDSRLKAIALALDTYRQEQGLYPPHLTNLITARYLRDNDALRCPDDVRPGGNYDDYYVVRPPRRTSEEKSELPQVLCPFHEAMSSHAGQVYTGRTTTQFLAHPARLSGANNVTVQHPDGKPSVPGTSGLALHGGDTISTGSLGSATITFADGSTARLVGGCKVTVLQSYTENLAGKSTLYSLLRQSLGVVTYTVTTGSKFDVATPTATAGAHGTAFIITVRSDGTGSIRVTEGKVLVAGIGSGVSQLVTSLNSLLNLPF